MKIAVDVMGGDHGVSINVKACVDAIKEYNVTLVLVGKEEEIREELKNYAYEEKYIEIVHAPDVISNDEKAGISIRKKKDSSMVKALYLVKDGEADAVISSGSTGALLSGATIIVGRIKGIKRPALAPVIPTQKKGAVLIDAGANVDSKPIYLQQFAIMGSIYADKVLNYSNPRVGIANIGEEPGKGNALVKEAYGLVENAPVNFSGNLEMRDVFDGDVDVIVCDGFVGNTILKVGEGLAKTIFKILKHEIYSSSKAKLGALLLKGNLKNMKAQLDYTEYGGAPFLGVNGCVIKAHGSSDSNAIKNAIRQAKQYLDNNVTEAISNQIKAMEQKEEV